MNISIETPSDELIEIMMDDNLAWPSRAMACQLLKKKIQKLVEDSQRLGEKIKQLTGSK